MADDLPDDFEVPDDLSSLLDAPPEDPSVVLVITQVAAPAPLAAACAIAKVEVDVVPTDIGAIATTSTVWCASMCVSPVARTVRSMSECLPSAVSMWS